MHWIWEIGLQIRVSYNGLFQFDLSQAIFNNIIRKKLKRQYHKDILLVVTGVIKYCCLCEWSFDARKLRTVYFVIEYA